MRHEPDDEFDDIVIDAQFDAALHAVLDAVLDVLAEREEGRSAAEPVRARIGVLSALVGVVGTLVAESAAFEDDLTAGASSRLEPAWLSFRDALIDLAACALETGAALSINAPGTAPRGEHKREFLLAMAYWELRSKWLLVGPSPAARPLEWLAALTEAMARLTAMVVEIDAATRGEPHATESVRQRGRNRPDERVDPLSWAAAGVSIESVSLAGLAIYAATAISFDPVATPTTWSDVSAAGEPDTRAHTLLDIRQLQPPVQTRLRDPEIHGDLRQRRVSLTRDRDHVTAKLHGECLRHNDHPFSEDLILTDQQSTETGADPTHANVARCR